MTNRYAITVAITIVGCTPAEQDPTPGYETGPCADGSCLSGLVCEQGLCVSAGWGDSEGDTGTTASDEPRSSSVSILVVLDDSGMMAEEQVLATQGIVALTDSLSQAGIDWRLGVTPTDLGNDWCGPAASHRGQLRATSCRSRPTEFSFDGDEWIDAFDESCAARCPEEWTNIEIQATPIEGQAERAPRPWVESIDGSTNLPEDLSVSDALACLVPQGIGGCGFEQPLEAMAMAIDEARTDGGANWGFLPDDALLVVLLITNEADCSVNPEHREIFASSGTRVFWSDPEALVPNSALCWNAGVRCDGSDCASADLDENGEPVGAERAATDAVLHPVSRYVDRLSLVPDVLVAVISGVEVDGSVAYRSSVDAEFEAEYGIGPGCDSAVGPAVPPVRLRELAQTFQVDDAPHLVSICGGVEAPLLDLAEAIQARVR